MLRRRFGFLILLPKHTQFSKERFGSWVASVLDCECKEMSKVINFILYTCRSRARGNVLVCKYQSQVHIKEILFKKFDDIVS